MSRTLISILGGLGGMVGWGTSDFFANYTSEKIGHTNTFFWSQIAGLVFIFLLVLTMVPNFALTPLLIFLTIVSGIAYAIGYLLFYKGFEIGNVSVVSAVVNLGTLFMIVISFLVRGQRVTPMQIPALTLLLVGVILVSINVSELRKGIVTLLSGVRETLAAAVLFGVFYFPLNEFVVERTDWLAVSFLTKLTAIIVVCLLSLVKKQSLVVKASKKLWMVILAVGVLEASAVLSVTFGLAYGDGIIVTPISSALTVVTVILAMLFSSEKINRLQALGIALVVSGVVMTAF